MVFSERLSQLRKEKGMSQELLAEKLNVSRQAVSKWETAEASPDMTKLLVLSDVLDVSLDALCGRDTALHGGEPPVDTPKKHRTGFNWLCLLMLIVGLTGGIAGGIMITKNTAPTETADTAESRPLIGNITISSFNAYLTENYPSQKQRAFMLVFSSSAASDEFGYKVTKTDSSGRTKSYDADYSDGVCTCFIVVDYYTEFTLSAVISDGINEYTAGLMNVSWVDETGYTFEETWNEQRVS